MHRSPLPLPYTSSLAGFGLPDDPNSIATAEWVRRSPEPELLKAELLRVWRSCPPPFPEWAERVRSVALWSYDRELSLVVTGVHPAYDIVQYAPGMMDRPSHSVRGLLEHIGTTLNAVLQAAPGLSIGGHGELLNWMDVVQPLRKLSGWLFDVYKPSNAAEALQSLLVEIVTTAIGDLYLLAKDQAVLFFDHEECEILHCSISAEQLLAAYFREPDAIIEPLRFPGTRSFWKPQP